MSTSKANAANGRKGKKSSPWSRWNDLKCKYPQLNTSKRLREPCTYKQKTKETA